jgi:High potential iron-sulfur protein
MEVRGNRRVFMLKVIAGSAALGTAAASAAEPAAEKPVEKATIKVSESDPYPKSMGFRFDTNDVDQAKFPRHEVSQHCSECQLFSGATGEEWGTCSFFKRLVPPNGWCRNFKQKKAKA